MNESQDTFGGLLAELRSLFPSELIGDASWEQLVALSHRLPIHVAENRFGFEFDLCDPDPAADFCVVPAPGTPLAGFYVRQGDQASPGSAEAALGSFLADQARDPDSLLARNGGGVILEYDLAGIPLNQLASPGIFLVPGNLEEESVRALLGDPEPLVSALWAVAGWEHDAEEWRQVQQIYEALPPHGKISQAGVLPGRRHRALRFIIQIPSTDDAVEMLEKIRWPGSTAEVAAVLDGVEELTRPSMGLSVDVTSRGVSHRLGLELFRPVMWYELDRSGWKRLLYFLAEPNQCRPAKIRGLQEWPRLESMFAEDGVYQVRQNINHVKVVMDRGNRSVKAYVGMYVLKVKQSGDAPDVVMDETIARVE